MSNAKPVTQQDVKSVNPSASTAPPASTPSSQPSESTPPASPPMFATAAPNEKVEEVAKIEDIKVNDAKIPDVRIAVVGNVDSGKSTLIGVLTGGQLDNGRGQARARVFMHHHEAQTGRTSAIGQHILGFNAQDAPVHCSQPASASAAAKNKAWAAVLQASTHLVTFVDLAGHEKYLKTTIAGLTGCFPDYSLVIVNSLAGITKMTREHLGILLALDINFCVVVTKVDMCPENVLARTKAQLVKILKSPHVNKLPMICRDAKDVATVQKDESGRVCPLFLVSSTVGTNVDLLLKFLSGIRPNRKSFLSRSPQVDAQGKPLPPPSEFCIEETFSVTGVGTVVSGTIISGVLKENTVMLLGPGDNNEWLEVLVKSIHRKRVPVTSCDAGESCAVGLKPHKRKEVKRSSIRRGMVLIEVGQQPRAAQQFDAEVLVLHHPTTMGQHYQAVVHSGIIRQTAEIVSMTKDCLRTGDKATVRFRFLVRPEFIHEGNVLVFREGTTKGLGKITRVIYDDSPDAKLPTPPDAKADQTQPQPQPDAKQAAPKPSGDAPATAAKPQVASSSSAASAAGGAAPAGKAPAGAASAGIENKTQKGPASSTPKPKAPGKK